MPLLFGSLWYYACCPRHSSKILEEKNQNHPPKNNRKKQKPTKTERPRNRPSVFINCHNRCDSRLVENLAFAKCLYHGGVFWHFVSIKTYAFLCFIAAVLQSMLNTLKKTLRFLNGFAFRHSASESFPSLQLVDRLCNDIPYISISMYVSLWQSLDICDDHSTLARQATWQHLAASLPVLTIYCTSMGKHLWVVSLDTAHGLFKLALGVVH